MFISILLCLSICVCFQHVTVTPEELLSSSVTKPQDIVCVRRACRAPAVTLVLGVTLVNSHTVNAATSASLNGM